LSTFADCCQATASASHLKLLLFSRSGFTSDLTEEAAGRPDVELVGLARVYQGT
jgi:hypothetical protein